MRRLVYHFFVYIRNFFYNSKDLETNEVTISEA